MHVQYSRLRGGREADAQVRLVLRIGLGGAPVGCSWQCTIVGGEMRLEMKMKNL
jgi:hypothetical protein